MYIRRMYKTFYYYPSATIRIYINLNHKHNRNCMYQLTLIPVKAEIFVVTIYRGDKFSWVRMDHRNYRR